jgi:cystathionine beta-lyase/cystathionine gamma-synthase
MELSHILNQLGEDREGYFNAVSPPIIQSSNFAFRDVAALREALRNEFEHDLYSRGNNPTVGILRKKLAALDEAEDSLVFGAGVGAIAIPILSLLRQGDHVVSVARPYNWTVKLFDNMLPKYGITTTYVDGTRIENFEQALQPNTKLLFLESPNSFTFELQDIPAVVNLARSRGLLTMIDNSYCSPIYQKPYAMGVDLVAQTATKFIGGHSDVVAGVVSGSRETIRRIFENEFMTVGGNISPFNAWLLIRGLRTLPLRLERICASTKKIVNALADHPRVEKIIFPFHPSFAQYDLALKQMKDCGGLFSIVLKAQRLEEVERFCNSLEHFLLAVSWGGHESLVIPWAAGMQPSDFNAKDARHRTVRFYIGLEDPDYLLSDIHRAFSTLGSKG